MIFLPKSGLKINITIEMRIRLENIDLKPAIQGGIS
jgi:hypothetical protein